MGYMINKLIMLLLVERSRYAAEITDHPDSYPRRVF